MPSSVSVPPPRKPHPATNLQSARTVQLAGPITAGQPAPTAHLAVRDAQLSDLRVTAELHVRELPVGLFPRMGTRFVARWHRVYLESRHAVALVARDESGHVVGFLLGSTDREALRRDLLDGHRAALTCLGLLALSTRPRTLHRFLRSRLRPYLRRLRRARRSTPEAPADLSAVGDLTAVAVRADRQRTGAGSALVGEFLRRCDGAGTGRVELLAATTAPGATEFYTRTGWAPGRCTSTRDGESLRLFSFDVGTMHR